MSNKTEIFHPSEIGEFRALNDAAFEVKFV